MNNVVELKGKRFAQASKNGGGGGAAINSKKLVTINHLTTLSNKLNDIKEFWKTEKRPFDGILVSVHYNKIAAKSNRISGLLKGEKSTNAIVGAKFNKEKSKHIITYYLDILDLDKSMSLLSITSDICKERFANGVDKEIFDDNDIMNAIPFGDYNISKNKFKQVIADVSYIDDFEVEHATAKNKQSIVTIYDTGLNTKELLKNIGLDILDSKIIDEQTLYLDDRQVKILYDKVPYLISMATEDLSELSPSNFIENYEQKESVISSPTIEPTIGVIDTLFDESVYFSDWVDYTDLVDENIPKSEIDYNHGTAVSSIIVDGPRLNPWLDDGCGRFKVRHFGVALGTRFSSFTVLKRIKHIVEENRDIKVWNISLGSNQEINDNFISAEASVLDQIQYERDVIFVVAGTNKPNEDIVKIGSPADSINSMVVNAVTKSGLSTKYARRGLALSFFAKPDVSYYGGSEEEYIKVIKPSGEAQVAGTSFAAPWIARKLSYLIDILGLKKEIAKALIIDAARGWKGVPSPEEVSLYGHGIVPIKIDDIIHTKDDEIKFLVTDTSEKWNTYNYEFPVPRQDDKYPYVARATMAYFPKCDRTQGVDYTNTELNLHFGRIDNKGKIKDIVGDKQNQDEVLDTEKHYILESTARERFRKWDNVKYIVESSKKRMLPKKSYENKNWGMEVKTNNRLNPEDGIGVRFGVVVTLKEMNGKNRIDEFIRSCTLNGWLVNEIDIKSRINLHEKVNEDIAFS